MSHQERIEAIATEINSTINDFMKIENKTDEDATAARDRMRHGIADLYDQSVEVQAEITKRFKQLRQDRLQQIQQSQQVQ
jgi:hypothetical protein